MNTRSFSAVIRISLVLLSEIALAENIPRQQRPGLAAVETEGSEQSIACDGTNLNPDTLVAAMAAAAASNQPLQFQARGGPCMLLATMDVASGISIEGVGNPTLFMNSDTVTTIMKLNNVTGVTIRSLSLDGGAYNHIYRGHVEPIVNLINASENMLENITIKNAPRDIRLQGGSKNNKLRNINVISPGYYRALSGENITFHGITLQDAHDNIIEDFSSVGQAGWTVGVIGTSSGNRVVRAKSTDSGLELIGLQYQASHNFFSSVELRPNSYPHWSAGRSVTRGDRVISDVAIPVKGVTRLFQFIYIADSTGVTGSTAPDCKSPFKSPHPATPLTKCSDGGVTWSFWRDDSSASDNCISITGSYNSVLGGYLEKCRGHGVSLYGDHNSVSKITVRNAGAAYPLNGVPYHGINLQSEFSGISQQNIVTGNTIEDTNATPTIREAVHAGGLYRSWSAGSKISNPFGAATYAVFDGQLFKTFSIGKVTAYPPPKCVSNSCLDGGGVEWQWVRSVPQDASPVGNIVSDNTSSIRPLKARSQ